MESEADDIGGVRVRGHMDGVGAGEVMEVVERVVIRGYHSSTTQVRPATVFCADTYSFWNDMENDKLLLCDSYTGFMYSADADGRGHFYFYFKFFIIFYFVFVLACIYLRAQLERDLESDRLGHPLPPRIMILWRSIESTGIYLNKNIHYS